jgi:hypothetical protein
MWSLTSLRAKRISGSKIFTRQPKKTFATVSARSGPPNLRRLCSSPAQTSIAGRIVGIAGKPHLVASSGFSNETRFIHYRLAPGGAAVAVAGALPLSSRSAALSSSDVSRAVGVPFQRRLTEDRRGRQFPSVKRLASTPFTGRLPFFERPPAPRATLILNRSRRCGHRRIRLRSGPDKTRIADARTCGCSAALEA